MFSIAVRYLNGWAMATHPTDRGRAEWPPHPDRLFMALVAAAAEEARFDDALRWLEAQPPPGLHASAHEQREVVTSYVPVNDPEIARPKSGRNEKLLARIGALTSLAEAKSSGLELLPEFRVRQPRTFPVAIPHDPNVHFVYADDPPTQVSEQLAFLCTRVTRVGHSASLVQCWLETKPPAASWVPSDGAAQLRLRVPSPGRLQQLRDLFALNAEQGTDLRPTPGIWAGYSRPLTAPPPGLAGSVFDPAFLLLRPVPDELRRPPLVAALQIVNALRGLLMSATDPSELPQGLSGHTSDGQPLERPHLAIAPLPFVGHEHADGRLMGLALILPRVGADAVSVADALNRRLYTPDGLESAPLTLRMGTAGEWTLEASDDFGPSSCRPESWIGAPHGARVWGSVTPIALDRHAKGPLSHAVAAELAAGISEMCVRIGLPRPEAVEVSGVSLHRGVPCSGEFPRLARKDGTLRRQTHAVIRFGQPVIGPVLLGAGRYRGYGLCKPWTSAGGGL
ncbi:MAG: type I-U CRISPR-associated protein Csb2 [Planctomycetota bacterium]